MILGWHQKKKKSEIIQTGFIAQEVEAAVKELGYDFSGADESKITKTFMSFDIQNL